MIFRLCVFLCLIASPVWSDCLTAADFDETDIPVGLQGGDQWQVNRRDGGVMAQYSDSYGEPLRWQGSHHGVYPAFEQQNASVDPAAENTSPFNLTPWTMETVYDSPPPEPVAGGNWAGSGSVKADFDGAPKTWAFSVAYSFDPEKTVTLSGCQYRAIGVNGAFHASSDDWMGRWVYFPDLKVAVQTKGNDSRTGEAWTNGMIALGE